MTPQVRTQTYRFLRLFVVVLLTQAAALDLTHLGRSAIIALIVGAAETTWRQLHPTVSAVTAPPAKAPPMPAPPNPPATPPPPRATAESPIPPSTAPTSPS